MPTSKGLVVVQAAVFGGADVDVGGGGVEGDGDGVGGGGGGFDVGGVVDRLAQAGAAGGGNGQLVGVACGVGDRGDVGGGVVPADGHDVGVPGGLGSGVGGRHRGLIGLRGSGIHLHKRRRSGDRCRCGNRSVGNGERRGCRQSGDPGRFSVDELGCLDRVCDKGCRLLIELSLVVAPCPGECRPQRRRFARHHRCIRGGRVESDQDRTFDTIPGAALGPASVWALDMTGTAGLPAVSSRAAVSGGGVRGGCHIH